MPPDAAIGIGLLRRAGSISAGVCLSIVCLQAHALHRDMLFLRGDASVTYDSNVLRVSDSIPPADADAVLRGRGKSDLITGVGAGLRLDVPVSRQRFRGDVSVANYRYSDFDELDYTGYEARGIWNWRLGNDWYGEINAGTRQARQAYSSAVGAFVPRLYTANEGLLDARYAITPRWELRTSGNFRNIEHRDEGFRFDDFDYWAADFGALYRTPAGSAAGARLRYERGDWPNRPPAPVVFFGNEYTQYTLSALIDWRPTGRSHVYGDLGYTVREREAATDRDFDGLSGILNYDYSMTGKTTLRGTVYQTRGAASDFTATYIRTTGLDVLYIHQVTAKTSFQATASHRRQDYLGDSLVPGIDQRRDKLNLFGLEGSYRTTRIVAVSGGVHYEARSSNIPLAAYDAYTIYLRAGVEF